VRRISLLAAVVALGAAGPAAAGVSGDYLEVRTADVWTGPCVANGQVGLEGKEAILAVRATAGSFEGVGLAGRAAVAVLEARATLGDPQEDPAPVRALVLLDEQATSEQRTALLALLRSLAAPFLKDDPVVLSAPIAFVAEGPLGRARLEAGGIVQVEVRPLDRRDLHCGNEEVYYPPLVALEEAVPAATVLASYSGTELGKRWRVSGTRGAFRGSFRK